ncbi:ATP-dependent DNA helicase RecG [Fibrobacter sp. UWB15]|uniref:ATP-binding protein n=1 Tax=unclassified Fibrobacter TaxID=2634177 RepID=UPI000922741C|nr:MULTISPECIES: ATP-binding protein [unclassified Fibrobacter]PWJ64125.1 ATP-dependent DNA helicase RecG [Fibrobacter sp. UWB6]SHG21563.1 ATP-dependent DNA helicase RecG [Fibrobacter sp. UWB8]SMG28987.1 ATP-dependent DNA helicase RecG [Fibrobacter sp. UWB15]
MKLYTAQELYKLLSESDECVWIEAKGESDSAQSLMESVCSFCNEPGLGGGYILLGIGEDTKALDNRFWIEGVENPDKAQLDISTRCASMFNLSVRPRIDVEKLDGKNVLKIFVPELPSQQKPLYFKSVGLPQGAWRRIGSSDQRCTEEDLYAFYQDNTSFDSSVVKNTSFDDVDLDAVKYYRRCRKEVNPKAEELNYSDRELLESLECLTQDGNLTFAGVMLFGTKRVIRRFYPLMRTDYIRVRGNEWVENVDERFSAIEFMGPLMLQIDRMIDAVLSDLPQNFSLKEGQIRATTKPDLPERVIREAIVNAVMHRSYRHNRPTQIIRYNNRIEIINSGYSLKAQEEIGTAGSDTRNQLIASILHETNLAEFKGTGIRTMRRLMTGAGLSMPTFESDRTKDTFTIRLLLHKFFDEGDEAWLSGFGENLTQGQRSALIFAREVGAVDTLTYMQIVGEKRKLADLNLDFLKKMGVLKQKGKTVDSVYYVLNSDFDVTTPQVTPQVAPQDDIQTKCNELVLFCRIPRSKKEMMAFLKLSDRKSFDKLYLKPLLNKRIRYTVPDKPNSRIQKYVAIGES